MERRVVRLITAGTFLDVEGALEDKRNNFLVSIAKGSHKIGLAVLDAGTGELKLTEIPLDQIQLLLDELARLQPAEGLWLLI